MPAAPGLRAMPRDPDVAVGVGFAVDRAAGTSWANATGSGRTGTNANRAPKMRLAILLDTTLLAFEFEHGALRNNRAEMCASGHCRLRAARISDVESTAGAMCKSRTESRPAW